jgi:hypothetical protein
MKEKIIEMREQVHALRMMFMVPFCYLLVGGHHNLLASMTVAESGIERGAIFTSCSFSCLHVSEHPLCP